MRAIRMWNDLHSENQSSKTSKNIRISATWIPKGAYSLSKEKAAGQA